MSNDKLREEFEAAFSKKTATLAPAGSVKDSEFEKLGGFEVVLLEAMRADRVGNSYGSNIFASAWWAWKHARGAQPTWQPMESCPKHVDVLFFNERNGVIPGRLTDADSFMTDKERDEWDGGEEAQFRIDAFGFGHWGVDRMEGSEAPTHWMPYPEAPEVSQ